MTKWVYAFGGGAADSLTGEARDLLGGKGANLAEMARLGLPGTARLYPDHGSVHRLLRQ